MNRNKDQRSRATMTRMLLFMLCVGFLLASCTPRGQIQFPSPDTGTPASKRFHMTAEGNDALLGPSYSEVFEGNAAFSGSVLQLWSDDEIPNRILEVTYHGGGTMPAGSYRVVGRESDITDPLTDVIVTYTLAQGAFCTEGCDPQDEPVSDYYFVYYGTTGTVTIRQTDSGQLTGDIEATVQQYSYYANLEGSFNAVLGK